MKIYIRFFVFSYAFLSFMFALDFFFKRSQQNIPHKISDTFKSSQYILKKSTCEKKKTHLYFLKVHKSGSTTVQNILLRFGMTQNLSVLTLFNGFHSAHEKHFDHRLPDRPPKRLGNYGKYDIYCEHSLFDKDYLLTKLHQDTINIGIIREPFSQFRSIFSYYDFAQQLHITNHTDPVAWFLHKSQYQDRSKFQWTKFAPNLVAKEFGYIAEKDNIKQYLSYIESNFPLVLIMEEMSQSLILMKRKLCWEMKDVLYSQARKNTYNKSTVNTSLVKLHKAWNPVDHMIYEHFTLIHKKMVGKQDNDFTGEVAWFEEIQEKTNLFCDHICLEMGQLVRNNASDEMFESVLRADVSFPETQWDAAFTFDGFDCLMMRFEPQVFRDAQKVALYPEACHGGLDPEFQYNPSFCSKLFRYNFPWYVLRNPWFVSYCY